MESLRSGTPTSIGRPSGFFRRRFRSSFCSQVWERGYAGCANPYPAARTFRPDLAESAARQKPPPLVALRAPGIAHIPVFVSGNSTMVTGVGWRSSRLAVGPDFGSSTIWPRRHPPLLRALVI